MREVHGQSLINKYFQYIPRLPVITLTNSNAKAITIPEDGTFYSFCKEFVTLFWSHSGYISNTYLLQIGLSERGSFSYIRISF